MNINQEGFIEVTGGKVWYGIVGKKTATPLIVLHGGPGYPHDSLEPLGDLVDKRRVIFYDQLGCGNSGKSHKKALWTVDRFVNELREVIKTLGLEKYHILGHSWGAALAVSFALTKPNGLKSLILSDPYISTPQWEKDAKRLIKKLPSDMQKAFKKGIKDSGEYKKASKEYYYRYVNHLEKIPVAMQRASNKMNLDIYHYMWGDSEFIVNGTLKDFDPTIKIPNIEVPILLLCGRFDEATPEAVKYFNGLFHNSHFKIFEDSAHTPFWNQRKEYIKTVQDFLQSVE